MSFDSQFDAANTANKDLRILILDDVRSEADAIEQTLHGAGVEFIASRANGRDNFLRALEEKHPDIVVASSNKDSIDAFTAVNLVREKSPGVPVVVITGPLDGQAAAKLARAGAHDYVSRDRLGRIAFTLEHARSSGDNMRIRRQVERDLTFSAALLEAEHEASHDGILVVDPDGHMVSFNRMFVEMWQVPPEIAASRSDRRALDSVMDKLADPEAFMERVRYLYQHPEEKSTDEVVLKDGRTFYRYTTPMLHQGRYFGRVWFFHDITQFKEAERKILEDATQFRGLVEQELAGIFILRPDGTIAYVNPRFLKMLDYTQDDALGHPVTDFIMPEDRTRVLNNLQDLTKGKSLSNQVMISLRHKNGSPFPVLGQGTIASYQGAPAIIGVTLDISELRRTQASLERLNRVLKTLSAGNEALVRAPTEQELLNNMCRVMVDTGGYRFCWIGFAQNDAEKSVRAMSWADHGDDYVETLGATWADSERGHGPTGTAIRTGEPVVNQDFATNPALKPWSEEALKRGYESSIALPLKDGEKVFGAFTIYAAEPNAFNPDEVRLLRELASDLSYGIVSLRARVEREENIQRLRRSMQATVLAIASTLELRDPYTAGHQRDVAKLATAIARDIGVPEDEIEGIYLAGVVHDIGKIQIPSEILAKPGKLTKLEYQLIQTHAQAGYDIIKGVEFPWPVADMILQHHERLDGSGYPKGLKADQILLGAKIIAVADVVQAMTARRPYRAAIGLDAALAEIERQKGKKYHPPAVDACIALFRQKGFKFESGETHD